MLSFLLCTVCKLKSLDYQTLTCGANFFLEIKQYRLCFLFSCGWGWTFNLNAIALGLPVQGEKKKQEKGKVQSDTLEMQHNEKVKCYGGKI